MSLLSATLWVFKKDARIELRSGEILVTTSFFAMLVAILTSLSFYVDDATARRVAPGVLWVSIAFSGVLAMGRSWSRERDNDVMRGLLLAPIPRAALFLGKTLSVLAFLLVVEALLLPLTAVLYHLDLLPRLGEIVLLLLLGTIAFSAAGTLFAAMGVRTGSRELMLSVVLFPLIAPALLGGVVATRELLGGASLSEILDWVRILLAFDLVFVVMGALLFEPLTSD